jgi:hypothetical protein
MSLTPLFLYGKGPNGESHGEEKEKERENEDLKREGLKRASLWATHQGLRP